MKSTIAIAVSGGIDSLYAALMLKEKGHRIFGLHFSTGYEGRLSADIAAIVAQIDLPLHVIDLRDAFKTRVIDYFIRSYHGGKTPNPCLVCNPQIKLGHLWDIARQKGADRLATGHYARIVSDRRQRRHLLKGVDNRKDQSYFLAFLSQEQLQRAVFPLGELTKKEVKRRVAQMGLNVSVAEESQDVCFIRGTTYGDFLQAETGLKPSPGDIVDLGGKVIGRHQGLHLFTVGQRRGINCPAAEPYYVVRLEAPSNRLVVGTRGDLAATGCRLNGTNWIQPAPAHPLRVDVKIRYRHRAAPAVLTPIDRHQAAVDFDSPQSAVTPGQGAVFYQGEEVLGGGWIESTTD